jgi:hypothetical protein
MRLDDDIVRAGRRRLRELLPWARAEARKDKEGRVVRGTALADAVYPYVIEKNFEALVIYRAPLGGWHADLLLKGCPPGVPNAMGSPVAQPFRTHEDAEGGARSLLVTAVRITMENAKEAAEPAFLLYDSVITMNQDFLHGIEALRPPSYTKERAIEMIADAITKTMPDGYSVAGFNELEHRAKSLVLSAVYVAATVGVLAYPPRRDATPSGHSAAETSQARH